MNLHLQKLYNWYKTPSLTDSEFLRKCNTLVDEMPILREDARKWSKKLKATKTRGATLVLAQQMVRQYG